jgi:branched-chain amino acid transport system substrate-binding protein
MLTFIAALRPIRMPILAALILVGQTNAQHALAAEPIKIGFSMALSGGLAENGKAALVAMQMWADKVNRKGGLLGRKVQLIHYDDQSNPNNVPGIYTKLTEIDKVDVVVSPYGTNLMAPAMPVVMQKHLTMMGLFGVGVNDRFNYDRYFQIMPMGPKSGETIAEAFFSVAKTLCPAPKSVAIVGADAEFGRVNAEAARGIAKQMGLDVVYDRDYPPSTLDFAPIVRAVQASKPDLVFLASYPTDTVGIVRSINEIGLKARLIGGGPVGLQFAAIKTQLGPLINNMLGYELYVPASTLKFPGIDEFIAAYQAPGDRPRGRPARLLRPAVRLRGHGGHGASNRKDRLARPGRARRNAASRYLPDDRRRRCVRRQRGMAQAARSDGSISRCFRQRARTVPRAGALRHSLSARIQKWRCEDAVRGQRVIRRNAARHNALVARRH